MQKTVYYCDHCKKEMGQVKSFSFSFGPYSGVANPPKKGNRWEVNPNISGRFIHLHRGCLLKFFSALITGKGK
jgi:hypothetical protein